MTDSRSPIQQTLEQFLGERKMSLLSLSKKSGVSRSTISGWLHGSRPRDLAELKRVADALDVSFELLCLGQDDQELSKVLHGARKKLVLDGYYRISMEKLTEENTK